MSTSGTTIFALTRDQIIQFALRKIGVLELGVTPNATEVTNAAQALDMMIKSWITKGVKLWTVQEIAIPLVSGTSSYVIGPTSFSPAVVAPKPMKLVQAWLRDTTTTPYRDIPVMCISKQEYNKFGSKFSSGVSNSCYLEVGRDTSTLYTYLTPSTTSAATYQMRISTQRTIEDAGTASSTLDFPTEWLYALGWNLAAELATDYGVEETRIMYIEQKAAKFLSEVEDFDTEWASVTFAPDMRHRSK